uniref:Uncharacterized protein n=1 Tax=Arundo donax TaxID=35708 RepID=A0A0A9BP26_ARUDO
MHRCAISARQVGAW